MQRAKPPAGEALAAVRLEKHTDKSYLNVLCFPYRRKHFADGHLRPAEDVACGSQLVDLEEPPAPAASWHLLCAAKHTQ
eukprot:scaffold205960_cov27-Prasinocladus_malaysianus.AAC.2